MANEGNVLDPGPGSSLGDSLCEMVIAGSRFTCRTFYMTAEYPHNRYETWRTHFSPDSKPWTALTISETAHWVNVTEKEHNLRLREQTDSPFHWLSFVDNERPNGDKFLGAILFQAPTMLDALRQTHGLGINPGGEVVTVTIGEGLPEAIVTKYANRLLTKAECEQFDRDHPDQESP